MLYWLRDSSEGDADTLAFLDRRLATTAWLHRLRKRFDTLLEKLPRPPALRPKPL